MFKKIVLSLLCLISILSNADTSNVPAINSPEEFLQLTSEQQQAYLQNAWQNLSASVKDVPILIDQNGKLLAPNVRNDNFAAEPLAYNSLVMEVKRCPDGGKGCDACCEAITPIFARNVGKNGLIITQPGVYCIAEDIPFDPKTSGLSAIIINASDVVILGNNRRIFQATGNTQTGTNGIVINGQSNVTIQDLTVENFTGVGIFGNSGNDILTLQRLNVINCGTSAGGIVGGAILLTSNNIKVLDSNFLENFFLGISIFGCKNFTMDHCSCDDTKGGASFPGLGTAAQGFQATPFPQNPPTEVTTENIVVTNCTFNRSTGSSFAIGAIVIGFDITTAPSNVLIENCVAMGIAGGALTDEAQGFATYGSNIVLRNCVADSVSAGAGTPFSGLARGYRAGGSNIVFENCIASNISGSGQVTAAGFASEVIGNQVTWRGCTAYNISNSGTPGFFGNGDAYGFGTLVKPGFISRQLSPFENLVFLGTGNVFESCIAENVTSTNGTAAGFRFASLKNPKVQNCTSNNNGTYGFWFADEISVSPTGLGTPVPSLNGIIETNTIEGNTTAGVFDATFTSPTGANNAYIANIARTNGPVGSNYTGPSLPVGTPIRIWTLPGAPAATDSNGILDPQLDNMDIRP